MATLLIWLHFLPVIVLRRGFLLVGPPTTLAHSHSRVVGGADAPGWAKHQQRQKPQAQALANPACPALFFQLFHVVRFRTQRSPGLQRVLSLNHGGLQPCYSWWVDAARNSGETALLLASAPTGLRPFKLDTPEQSSTAG
jgi:hypothetical protein